MNVKNFFKVTSLGLLSTIILGATSFVSAASGHAFSAGYKVSGDLDSTSPIQYGNSTYSSLGYSSTYTMNPSYNTLNSGKFSDGTRYLESKVILLEGHGADTGKLLFLTDTTGIQTGSSTANHYVGINTINFSKVDLVTFVGCRTAYDPVNDYSNLTVEAYRNGARNAVGFRQQILSNSAEQWLTKYHNKLKSGGTVSAAVQYANSFSYNDSRVKDIGFFGSHSTTINSVSNVATLSSVDVEDVSNPNTIYVQDDIEFTDSQADLANVVDYMKSLYPSFSEEDYEVSIYTLNKEQNFYTIDFVKKFGDFYTDLGYVVGIEDGKISSITDNNNNNSTLFLENTDIANEDLILYERAAISNLNQKAKTDKLSINFRNNEIRITEQKTQLYLDTVTNKTYCKVFTSYVNRNGAMDVDYYVVEI